MLTGILPSLYSSRISVAMIINIFTPGIKIQLQTLFKRLKISLQRVTDTGSSFLVRVMIKQVPEIRSYCHNYSDANRRGR